MPRDERLTIGLPLVRGHEPECRTARYVTDLGYELEDAERYCICPELHAYGDRLMKEAPGTVEAVRERVWAGAPDLDASGDPVADVRLMRQEDIAVSDDAAARRSAPISTPVDANAVQD